MLSQTSDQGDRSIAFYSRNVTQPWSKKDYIGIVEACKLFLPYIVGRKYTIMTDNRALQFLKNKDPMTGHLARWLDTLWDLDLKVKHHPGSYNDNIDGLSCQVWSEQDASFKGGRMLGLLNVVRFI